MVNKCTRNSSFRACENNRQDIIGPFTFHFHKLNFSLKIKHSASGYLNEKLRLWRDELLGGPPALHILVLKVPEGPGDGQRAVHPLDHDGAARVLNPLPLRLVRWLVILSEEKLQFRIRLKHRFHSIGCTATLPLNLKQA